MQYRVVATLGPASRSESAWRALLNAGADAFRLNTSHLSLEALEQWLLELEPLLAEPGGPYLVLDLQGSKWRLGAYPPTAVAAGETLSLVAAESTNMPATIPVPHPDFFRAAAESPGVILLNDAKTRLQIVNSAVERLEAVVERGGELSGRKGVALPGTRYRSEGLRAKDQAVLELGAQVAAQCGGVEAPVRYAVSYLRDGAEAATYRAVCGREAHFIAKIERQEALGDLDAIEEAADELWLCRGDLGAELGFAELGRAAARFARSLPRRRPSFLAGQVLEHMTATPTPTRAEICGLHDALAGGYHGVVLSDETAIGSHPLEACTTAGLFRDRR